MTNSNPKSPPVLLVDDETRVLLSYSYMIKSAGIENIVTLDDPRMVMPFLSENSAAVVVLDLTMPVLSGKDLLGEINRNYPEIPIIVATATNEIDTAVECMLLGARDYLVKPIEKSRLISSIQRALEVRNLEHEVSALKDSLLTEGLKNEDAFKHFMTGSKKILAVFKYIEAVANSPFPVLILGETGVGKELIARSIHHSSSGSKNLVVVNVSGLDDQLFTDTLFGHKKGAFTGAASHRDGLIVQADGGTLFLDEIGDLSTPSQVKLLRLIQEREYYPLGSDLPQKTDCRIITATNRDIKALLKEGKFRKDLYYRFMAHQIYIPPLRERKDDIPLLVRHFLAEAARSLHKKVPAYPPELITLLKSYDFPGNARELQALIYDAMSRYESGILSLKSFRKLIELEKNDRYDESTASDDTTQISQFLDGFPTLKQSEAFLIDKALKISEGNQGVAASMLGISRQALNKRLQRSKQNPKDTKEGA